MRDIRLRTLCIVCILLFASTLAADDLSISLGNRIKGIEDVCIRVRHGSVYIYPEYDRWDGEVEITEDYELYIDGRKTRLSRDEREMVREYYHLADDIIDTAHRIGWEGAKVGVQGAAIGIKAIVNVVKLISPHYTTEDLEEDMDREAEKIEAKAEVLEEKAEVIDEIAEDLVDLHIEMKNNIRELRNLRWF